MSAPVVTQCQGLTLRRQRDPVEDYQILKFEPGVTRYDLSEKALYTTVQRPDETNDSYLAMISLLRS